MVFDGAWNDLEGSKGRIRSFQEGLSQLEPTQFGIDPASFVQAQAKRKACTFCVENRCVTRAPAASHTGSVLGRPAWSTWHLSFDKIRSFKHFEHRTSRRHPTTQRRLGKSFPKHLMSHLSRSMPESFMCKVIHQTEDSSTRSWVRLNKSHSAAFFWGMRIIPSCTRRCFGLAWNVRVLIQLHHVTYNRAFKDSVTVNVCKCCFMFLFSFVLHRCATCFPPSAVSVLRRCSTSPRPWR